MRSAASWVLAIVLAMPAYGHADDLTAQKRADIKQLIGVTGGTRLSGQFADVTAQSISNALKRRYPELSPRVTATLRGELMSLFEERANAQGGLIDEIVLAYHKHFTHPEIRELLAFNQTPIGRKTLQALPAIMNETMAAGQAWGKSLAPEVDRRVEAVLKKEGIERKKKP